MTSMENLIDWHKSTYSFREGECVEVGVWTKSSRSYETGACVEVIGLYTPHERALCVAMRDTTQRQLGHVEFPAPSFAGLLGALK